MPEVSVVIPTYNRRALVVEAVGSVLAQTFPDYELIVVDDGSTDGTAQALAKYDARLRLVSQLHRGVAAARNRGAAAAGGRYLAFLDSDDLWLPRKLERQMAYLRSHPEFAICQTEELWFRNGVRVNPAKRHRKRAGDIFRESLGLCLISPSAVMMTRELFERAGGFDERLPACEDYDLWLRITRDRAVGLVPEPLVIKRAGHADQLSRSVWGLDRFRVLALLKLLEAGLAGERRAWVIETLRRKAAILSSGARKRGREEEARSYEALLGGL
jgi:GT2 family glycosyltransferase